MLMLCMLVTPALAEIYYGVPAYPNQELHLRTGPNTAYSEIGIMPQSTDLTALQYEEGNGVMWVLVEYWGDYGWVRGYTGLKRMDVDGRIPEANFDRADGITWDACMVYSAPYADAELRTVLDMYTDITMLNNRDGYLYVDGYTYIEYVDPFTGELSRGYADNSCIGYAY